MDQQLRQIKDIQVQADRICNSKVSLTEVEQFGKYSREMKSYLVSNIKDEFVMKLVQEIPDLENELEKKNVSSGILDATLGILGAAVPLFSRESRKVDRAKSIVREIQGKYSSIGFVLQNNTQ